MTILAGTAGTGKTTLALGFTATITTGGRWPMAAPGTRGNALIWSSEDNADDTLVPRLIASGADLNRCHFIDGITETGEKLPCDPAQDIYALHQAVLVIGGVTDRYRFDDKEGRGTWICSHCGSGDGFELLRKIFGWPFADAAKRVDQILGTVQAGAVRQERSCKEKVLALR